jgi:hypothetical protein
MPLAHCIVQVTCHSGPASTFGPTVSSSNILTFQIPSAERRIQYTRSRRYIKACARATSNRPFKSGNLNVGAVILQPSNDHSVGNHLVEKWET